MSKAENAQDLGGGDIHPGDARDQAPRLTANPGSGVIRSHVNAASTQSASNKARDLDEVSFISDTESDTETAKKRDVSPNDSEGGLDAAQRASLNFEPAALFSAIPADTSIAANTDVKHSQSAGAVASVEPASHLVPPPRMDSLAARRNGSVRIPDIPEDTDDNWPLPTDHKEDAYELRSIPARDFISPIPWVGPASAINTVNSQSNRGGGGNKSSRKITGSSDLLKDLPEIKDSNAEVTANNIADVGDRAQSSASMHVPAARSFGGTIRHERRLSSVAQSVDAASRHRSCGSFRWFVADKGLRPVVAMLVICAALSTPPITMIAASNQEGEPADSGVIAWLCLFLLFDMALIGIISLYYYRRRKNVLAAEEGSSAPADEERPCGPPTMTTRDQVSSYSTYQESRPPTPMPMLGGYGYRERDLGPSRLRQYVELEPPTRAARKHSNLGPLSDRVSPRPLVRTTSSKVALVPESAGYTATGGLGRDPSITTILCEAIVTPFSPVDHRREHLSPYLRPEDIPRSPTRRQKHMTADSFDIACGRVPM